MYSDLTDWTGGEIEFFSPKAGDLADYVAIKFDDGQRVTISNSCAANVLGLIKPQHFSYGNIKAARKAIGVLAQYCHATVEDIATQIMERSYAKQEPVIVDLAEKYKMEKKSTFFSRCWWWSLIINYLFVL